MRASYFGLQMRATQLCRQAKAPARVEEEEAFKVSG
jgi:hypothetical protein